MYTRNGNHIRNKINEIDDGLRDVVAVLAVLQVRRVCQLHKILNILGPVCIIFTGVLRTIFYFGFVSFLVF